MSVENEKEIQQLKNRIRELADKSYNQNRGTRFLVYHLPFLF